MVWRFIRKPAVLLILGLVLLASGVALLLGQWQWMKEKDQLESLIGDYVAFHNTGDIQGIRELIYWEGVSDRTRRIFLFAMQEESLFPIKGIRYRPYEDEDRSQLLGGVALPPQVKPRWRVWLELDSDDRFTSSWLIGETPEGLRFLIGQ